MQCPFCQNEMGNAQNACPHCKRPHSPYVAYYVAQGWNELKRGAEQQARAAFTEALRVTPPNDKPQLQSYVAYLIQQAQATGRVAPQPTPQAAVEQAAPVAAAAPPRSATVSAPALRPQTSPPAPKARVALFFNFNEKPAGIVQVMDDAVRKQAEFIKARGQRIWIVPLLLLAGLPFVYLDWLLGYNYFTFSLVALVLWGAAVVSFILLMRNRSVTTTTPQANKGFRGYCGWIVLASFLAFFCIFFGTTLIAIHPALLATIIAPIAALVGVIVLKRSQPSGQEFGPRFDAARAIFQTIKDDLAPKRTLMGWLDLTGAQPGKVIRQNTSSSGMPINYYRDEWLKMKMMLYDGNVMRVSALERIKARMGRWKRNRRGKSKWKAGGNVSRNELRVAITVNQEAYDVLPLRANQSGKFLIEARESGDGRIVLDALTDAAIGAQDILQLLRFAYDHLKPRGKNLPESSQLSGS
jgi:hypothetical protein